jgi:glycerophosphoryl diester phosphodiesterase
LNKDRQGVLTKDTLPFNQMMTKLRDYLSPIMGLLLLSWLLFACSDKPMTSSELDLEATPMGFVPDRVQIIAHRGARSLAPENTLAAATKAFENGADGWELDVAMSVDGELVLLHDDTLERTSNAAQVFPDRQPWSVYDFTLDELKQLDFGSWFVESDPFEQAAQSKLSADELDSYVGLPITTLAEALQFTRDSQWWVNIEIKDASDTPADRVIVSKVVGLIDELAMQDQVLISSFKHDYLLQVKTINPAIATGALVNKVVVDPVGLMRELDAQAFHPGKNVTYAKQVLELRAAGYAVNVWTVNEEAEMQELIAMGVTGIITDFPQSLKPLVQP